MNTEHSRPPASPAKPPTALIHIDDLRAMPPSRANDAMVAVAANLSVEDAGQVAASGPLTAEECIRANVHFSTHGWLLTDDLDAPVAIYGMAPAPEDGQGYVWLLGTTGLAGHVDAAADAMAETISDAAARYRLLTTAVDIRCGTTLDLLDRLGFRAGGEDVELGREARLFRPMSREF